jgi:hypothetical protein
MLENMNNKSVCYDVVYNITYFVYTSGICRGFCTEVFSNRNFPLTTAHAVRVHSLRSCIILSWSLVSP